MGRKTVSLMMLSLLLIGMLTLTFNPTIAELDEIESIGPVGTTDAVATQTVDWWPMFQHDPRHTGYSTSKAPKANRVFIWNSTLLPHPEYHCMDVTGLAISEGMVFVNTAVSCGPTLWMPARVFALNLTTGEEIWMFTTEDMTSGSPAVAYGLVFTCSYFARMGIYALNQTTGSQVWEYTIPVWDAIRASPTVADGMLFFSNGGNGVFALNATTGVEIWHYTADREKFHSSPAVTDNVVFVRAEENVYALNETTGEKIWNYTAPEGHSYTSPCVSEGVVFIGSEPNKVCALNSTTGQEIWSTVITGEPSWIAYYNDGFPKIFVSSLDGKVHRLNANNGALYWSKTVGGSIGWELPVIVADRMVFAGVGDDGLSALDEFSGDVVWHAQGYFEDVVIADDKLVSHGTGDENVTVYCFGEVHDVAVSNVTPDKTTVIRGLEEPEVTIEVNAENQGSYTETFNVTAYANTTRIGKKTVTNLTRGANEVLSFTWNTTSFAIGNYTISAVAGTVTNETDTLDNTYIDGTVTVRLPIHDVAVIDVTPSNIIVAKGLSLCINATLENQGDFTETFNVTAYGNTTIISTLTDITLTSGNSTTISFTWNTTDWAIGNYTISANATILPDETDTTDNSYIDGTVTVRLPIYDITITDVVPSKTVVGQSYCMSINITVENQGDFTESFNVSVFYDDTAIILPDGKNHTTTTLTSGDSTTLTIPWNTTDTPKGNYIIKAYAWPLPTETDTTDNTHINGWILVTIAGDVNGDRMVDMADKDLINYYFGEPCSACPNCDINCDCTIDMADVDLFNFHFGESW